MPPAPRDLSPKLFYNGPIARPLDLERRLEFEIEDGAVTGAASQLEVEACAADFALLNYYADLLGTNLALGDCLGFEAHEPRQVSKFKHSNLVGADSWHATYTPVPSPEV